LTNVNGLRAGLLYYSLAVSSLSSWLPKGSAVEAMLVNHKRNPFNLKLNQTLPRLISINIFSTNVWFYYLADHTVDV